MTIGIGLIGAGRMGQVFAYHLSTNVPGAKLLAIADIDAKQATQVAARFNVPDCYQDYNELLARKDIDAVGVVTPTVTHVQVVKDAAAAGKQIFSEKPLALTLKGCDEAIAAVKTAGVKLQVGFNRHFDAAYIAAKRKIEDGAIGEPVMFKSVGRDPRRTSLEFARRESSGGIIADMGIHDFDAARWLMGDEVTRVFSEAGCLVYPELQEVGDMDNALVSLRFAKGGMGNVDVSRNSVYGVDIRTEVLGSKGSLWLGRIQQTPLLVLTADGVTHDALPSFGERFAEAYAAEIRDFCDCVEKDRAPVVSGVEARAATAIAVAATRSLDESRPVELREPLGE
jgi:inositol 2-dehydrogenase